MGARQWGRDAMCAARCAAGGGVSARAGGWTARPSIAPTSSNMTAMRFIAARFWAPGRSLSIARLRPWNAYFAAQNASGRKPGKVMALATMRLDRHMNDLVMDAEAIRIFLWSQRIGGDQRYDLRHTGKPAGRERVGP